MGLFDFIRINPTVKEITKHEAAGRFIPITQVNNSDDLERFLKELVPLLHLEGETTQVCIEPISKNNRSQQNQSKSVH